MGAGWTAAPALSQQNSPANTVLLFEIQGNTCGNPGVPVSQAGGETCSGSGTGSISGPGSGNTPATNGNVAKYATGYIGGYTTLALANGLTAGVHTGGANYLACDGHVKFLLPSNVSGGLTAASANNQAVFNTTQNAGLAAGTNNLKLDPSQNSASVALTFSPV